jgi:hypothetical protein
VAVAEGIGGFLMFQPLIAVHEWNEAQSAPEVQPIGIEYPPQVG